MQEEDIQYVFFCIFNSKTTSFSFCKLEYIRDSILCASTVCTYSCSALKQGTEISCAIWGIFCPKTLFPFPKKALEVLHFEDKLYSYDSSVSQKHFTMNSVTISTKHVVSFPAFLFSCLFWPPVCCVLSFLCGFNYMQKRHRHFQMSPGNRCDCEQAQRGTGSSSSLIFVTDRTTQEHVSQQHYFIHKSLVCHFLLKENHCLTFLCSLFEKQMEH